MKTKLIEPEEINLAKLAMEYSDEDEARKLFESWHWPDGPKCPHCQNHKEKPIYKMESKATTKKENRIRPGLYCCGSCRKTFTARVGTVLEDSHIPFAKWVMAIFILCSSKKGVSAHQIHRMIGVTYKTAWFLCHRIRFAMADNTPLPQFKGTVEIDETYVGGKPRFKQGQAKGTTEKRLRNAEYSEKVPVVALIKRDGNVRVTVMPKVSHKNLKEFIGQHAAKSCTVNTDGYATYHDILYDWKKHDVVNHSIHEYSHVNKDGTVAHVNTCESFFSLIKRGIMGSFHHVSKEHLHRYCSEFGFRWDHRKVSDGERTVKAVEEVAGKRLTYRQAV